METISEGNSSTGTTTTVTGDEPTTYGSEPTSRFVIVGAATPPVSLGVPVAGFGGLPLPEQMAPVGIVMYPDTSLMGAVPNDDISQTSPAPPTSVLAALAAGRNPTDILIPSQAGTDGGSDDIHVQVVPQADALPKTPWHKALPTS